MAKEPTPMFAKEKSKRASLPPRFAVSWFVESNIVLIFVLMAVGSFAAWDANPEHWHPVGRLVLAIAYASISFVLFVMAFAGGEDE